MKWREKGMKDMTCPCLRCLEKYYKTLKKAGKTDLINKEKINLLYNCASVSRSVHALNLGFSETPHRKI